MFHSCNARQSYAMETTLLSAEGNDLPGAVQRLDSLHIQINALNEVLKEMLDSGASFPSRRKRLRRPLRGARQELLRFRQEARKLTLYAPY
jgi:uncharacterized protein HemX